MKLPDTCEAALRDRFGCSVRSVSSIGGGDVSRAVKVTLASGEVCCVKYSSSQPLEMFEAESQGLSTLRAHTSLCIPEPFKAFAFDLKKTNSNGKHTKSMPLATRSNALFRMRFPVFSIEKY